ncbi:hypothetical protein HGP14_23690 [Rhizobium sp. P32RR-XVIII]|uniref:hypothetical protein n=1 Tax=Rhizobium sp. P32RR-XVIII TaxID=2726738 RepID=UPI0014563A0C|nr:hypothetical protein [Rhizobium sp. P32RR-XVIII]NLS06323.1 hypothetical protein [Rhizobium sp. P32RR-XVIII]
MGAMMEDLPIQDFAVSLEAMSDDDLFTKMAELERASETSDADLRKETMARIALTEEVIERRFPGQLLAPYREWKRRQPIL